MANEASVDRQDGDLQYFSWTAATALTKGTVLVVGASDGYVMAHGAANQTFIGVAAADNQAGEANGTVTARTRGIMNFIAGGNVSYGDLVVLHSTANQVVKSQIASLVSLKQVVGIALSTATSGNTVKVLVPFCG